VLEDPHSFLEGQIALPPLPDVVVRLREIPDTDRARAAEVTELFASDAGLAKRLLTIVNSVCYDLPTPVKQIKHAVAYLGLAETKRAALAVGAMQSLKPEDPWEFQRFWRHAFHTALAAKSIARGITKVVDVDLIHTPALLHDLGKLAYLRLFPETHSRLCEYQRREACMFVDAERALGLPSHTRIGRKLCDRWSLPDAVKRGCESHELLDLLRTLGAEQRDEELGIICVANLLSNICTEELTGELKSAIQLAASRSLGLSDSGFVLLMGELYELRSQAEQLVQELG
jgi:putative nucleotidyltransferase with HDIG domain